MPEQIRCDWANGSELEPAYHDTVWGVPEHDDKQLFKMLCLESMQAGLSWSLILRRMEGLSAAFDNFDPVKLRRYDVGKIEALLQDARIIRNRKKIEAVIHNAGCYFDVVERYGSLDHFLWSYVEGVPIVGNRATKAEVPATTPLSDRLSKDLKKLGFKFVGSTTVYAFMQAVGMVNDHLVNCAFYSVPGK